MSTIKKIQLPELTLLCAALCFTSCKKKPEIVYLNPFEGREYFTQFSNGYRLSMIFTDDTHMEFTVPVRGKLKLFSYSYNPEKM